MGTDPSAAANAWLWEAAERQIPFICFLGVSPGRYQAIVPTFVMDWDHRRLTARGCDRQSYSTRCGRAAGTPYA
jgi:putative restriction endonuclease